MSPQNKTDASCLDYVIQCPRCYLDHPSLMLKRSAEGISISCSNCGVTFEQNPTDGFLVFSESNPVDKQQRSLLIHEKIGFNKRQLREAINYSLRVSLREVVSGHDLGKILDIGCGDGSRTIWLLEGLFDVYYGFEPSPIPEHRWLREKNKPDVVLIHNDLNKPLPVFDASVNTILFLGSYDHIQDRKTMILDIWKKLRPGGILLIVMSNYNYLPKKIVNFLLRRKSLTHNSEHYCVHDPSTLAEEITGFVPEAKVCQVKADNFYLPNLPKQLNFLYSSTTLIIFLNKVVARFIKLFGKKNWGSGMTVVFKKPESSIVEEGVLVNKD